MDASEIEILEAKQDGKDDSGKEVASGVYFYKLRSGNFHQTKRVVFIK